jgi:hypothetical protein
MPDPTSPQIPVHPVLAGATPPGQQPESVVDLVGYVGPSSRQGQIRLYHSLHDLSHYIEFDESSVAQTQPASEKVAPGHGLTVWLKASAPVRWTREYKSAKSLVAKIAGMAQGGAPSTPPGIP